MLLGWGCLRHCTLRSGVSVCVRWSWMSCVTLPGHVWEEGGPLSASRCVLML